MSANTSPTAELRRHYDSFMERFWAWYERHYLVNLSITTGLFSLQLIHLYWLTTHVVFLRLLGVSYFDPSPFWQVVIILVDYTEIPTLISTSLLYLYELRKQFSWRNVGFLIALNSQWIHLFWITDEFVLSTFAGTDTGIVLPMWLAWIAIFIDYLELPVIADTIVRVVKAIFKRRLLRQLKEDAKYHIWHI